MVRLTNAEKKRLREGIACLAMVLAFGDLTVDEIVRLTGQSRDSVEACLVMLVRDHELVRTSSGKYRAATVPLVAKARVRKQLTDGTL